MRNWVKERFAHHELWALDMAERLPFFAIFFAASLWVWAIPCLPVLIILTFLSIKWPLLNLLTALPSIALLLLVAPWFFRWYFISVSLMLGKTGMAAEKRKQILGRLTT
jgi:hypothetical protein